MFCELSSPIASCTEERSKAQLSRLQAALGVLADDRLKFEPKLLLGERPHTTRVSVGDGAIPNWIEILKDPLA